MKRVPKSQRIKEIQYIFVVFKNCETREVILDMFKKEAKMAQIVNQTFGMSKVEKTNKMMFAREIDVSPIIEPDEIIWENLSYTKDE